MRDRGLFGEDPLGFKTPLREDPLVDSRPPHGEEPVTLCIVLCWIWIVYLFVFRGSSTCVIVLVGLSDSLVSSPRVLRVLSWDPLLS